MSEAPQPARANVARETATRETRRYCSPYRSHQGDVTRARLVEAALALIDGGDLRPEARAIAAVAAIHPSAIGRHFGSLALLYRVVAREHRERVTAAADRHGLLAPENLAWAILVGKPREPA